MNTQILAKTIQQLAQPGKGILAADESTGTITKRFTSIQTECTEENRRAYREILCTTPGMEKFISGVIFYEETLSQKTRQGKPFPEFLRDAGIVPGIKVDKGVVALPNTQDEKITQGLDGLAERLTGYKKLGAQFAKWRAVLSISETLPSDRSIHANAEALASYAAICQQQDIVPIVEPELLMDGNHSLERCRVATETVLHTVFHALHLHGVALEYIVLKPNMVIAGSEHRPAAPITDVARETIKVLRRTVPAAVPTINFLSGGQSPELATAHLNAMNLLGPHPWLLSFSYGRALQDPALKAWQGKPENAEAAKQAFYKRAMLNALAMQGKYTEALEKAPATTA